MESCYRGHSINDQKKTRISGCDARDVSAAVKYVRLVHVCKEKQWKSSRVEWRNVLWSGWMVLEDFFSAAQMIKPGLSSISE